MKLSKDQNNVVEALKKGSTLKFDHTTNTGYISDGQFTIKVLRRTINALLVKRVIKRTAPGSEVYVLYNSLPLV